MAKKGSKKSSKLVGFSPPPKIIEEKPETETDDATYVYAKDVAYCDESVFVPDDEKIERVKKQVRADRIVKDRITLDFWLRHELQLGTGQIKKLWIKMDNVYR